MPDDMQLLSVIKRRGESNVLLFPETDFLADV